ncbi:MAG TPA: 6-carboxytetrahydropterin synthase, partial [Fimbriimonadaceae bacterium]|nr:6-carboxytetrahydropterin synthase [Fimbriimonadaceae bacterium]
MAEGAVPARVRLTRRVVFSSGHRYWIPALSEEENRALFGSWASPYNHGHNYVLEVSVEGLVDESTGMVVNIKTIDDILRERVVRQFDGKSINDEIPAFFDKASTLENLIEYVRGELLDLPEQAELVAIRLEEMPTLWVEAEKRNDWMITLTRTYEFAASHRLHSPALSALENVGVYGKCNNPAGHGHNYVLEVTVAGQPDPRTGMSVDLLTLDSVVNAEVVDRYDHKNLDCDIPEFQGRVTTSEIVVQEIWKRLDGRVPGELRRVRLGETARNIFEVSR